MNTAREKAIDIIRKQGGIIRTQEPLRRGIHRRTIYGLSDEGALIPTSRGLYQLSEMESFPAEIDLVNVAKLVPHCVICLISALSFHELTTEIPHKI